MTTSSPCLTHADIHRWTGLAAFQKGMHYVPRGAIYEARREGQTLTARCRGSQAADYQLQVTFGPAGIVSADCSCPVGAGGHCKHVVALLLGWFDSPDSFEQIEDPAALLEKHSKEELIALLGRMIEREPDLAVLLEMPLPGSKTDQRSLDAQVIRRQARQAMRGMDWEEDRDSLDGVSEAPAELQLLFGLARQYLAHSSPGNAAIFFREVAETVLEYEDAILQDESGSLGSAIGDCAEGLGECLTSILDPDQREGPKKLSDCMYMQFVEALIQRRGRDNYAQAAAYLKSVNACYLRLGELQTWASLIAHLREQHRNLPALRDEFD